MNDLDARLSALETRTMLNERTYNQNLRLISDALRNRSARDGRGDLADAERRIGPGSLTEILDYRRGHETFRADAMLDRPLLERLRSDAMMPDISAGEQEEDFTANLLYDPRFERLSWRDATTIGTTDTALSPDWEAVYVLNSGTAPTTRSMILASGIDGGVGYGSLGATNSEDLAITLTSGAGAGNITMYLQPILSFPPQSPPPSNQYLVASCRISVESITSPTRFTTLTATMQLLESGSVVAESDPLDLVDLSDLTMDAQVLAVVDGPVEWTVDDFLWRLKIVHAKDGSGTTDLSLRVTQPLLVFTRHADVHPYTPQIGNYIPSEVQGRVVLRKLVPSQITAATTHDYSPTGIELAGWLNLDTNGANTVTGIDATYFREGQLLAISYVGANSLILAHNTGSANANRFLLPNAANVTLGPEEGILLVYGAATPRWRALGVAV